MGDSVKFLKSRLKKSTKLPDSFNFPDITETSNDGQQIWPIAGDGFSLVQRKNKQQRTLTHEIKDVNGDVLGVEVTTSKTTTNSLYLKNSTKLLKPDDNSELKDNVLANAFRICIDKQDLVKIRDPNIWPSGVIIRDWIFNKHPNQIKEHTMESSNNKNINKE
ncbi:hypothetical protein HELRODRAFT_183583 [Helobdella robusta]|uniref:Uncharacterized protein n=1 Tax=Helobdella robusta TaxID=6412 RepID=T1FJV6_HELRO|nr:hypothetical protein HELRODRAFT_183583 [Helobdella robusta]ESO10483.1 hypothetical protein HELRODRAFT_183583 [Helobdella robusta]